MATLAPKRIHGSVTPSLQPMTLGISQVALVLVLFLQAAKRRHMYPQDVYPIRTITRPQQGMDSQPLHTHCIASHWFSPAPLLTTSAGTSYLYFYSSASSNPLHPPIPAVLFVSPFTLSSSASQVVAPVHPQSQSY